MQIKIFQTVLSPEPLIPNDIEGGAKDTLSDGFLKVGGIGLGPLQQAAVRQIGVKTGLFQTGPDHIVMADVLFFGPDGAGDGMGQLAQIPAPAFCAAITA